MQHKWKTKQSKIHPQTEVIFHIFNIPFPKYMTPVLGKECTETI